MSYVAEATTTVDGTLVTGEGTEDRGSVSVSVRREGQCRWILITIRQIIEGDEVHVATIRTDALHPSVATDWLDASAAIVRSS